MQSFVDSASKIPTVNGARFIKSNYLHLSLIIDLANPLVTNSLSSVSAHFAGSTLITDVQFYSYLASSSLLHTLDGWNYLANAVDSLLNGDPGIAIHLAYYAELRASMSFLAAEGIGIFSQQHLAIDRNNILIKSPIELGTHKFVWNCIDTWVNSNAKPTDNELLKVFSVNNRTFEDWANAFPFTTSVARNVIIKTWLSKWNLDVNHFKHDRDTRNFASYRPQKFLNTAHINLHDYIDKLNSFWEMLEPIGSNKFQLLDQHLLRLFIQGLYKSQSSVIKNQHSLEDAIKATISRLGMNQDQSLIDFLKSKNPTTNNLFLEASKNAIDPSTHVLNPLAVIARATLMLRMSAGTTSNIFMRAGITKSHLNFLWEKFGVDNGFWISGGAPNDFTELWDHINSHIEDVIAWVSMHPPSFNLNHIYEDDYMPKSFNFFKQFHRAGLWGLTF